MKHKILLTITILAMLMGMTACGDQPEMPYVGIKPAPVEKVDSVKMDNPLWQRHHKAKLKILCIGNSFTINATTYMPWLVAGLNNDSICIARLTRSGCSLVQHWTSHVEDTPDYDFYYSDGGNWHLYDIKTIDEALSLFDWDIITIQQTSGHSGLYRTYQPYLDNLVQLFRETNPAALLAWHYTWAYTPWTEHPEFNNYGRDSEKMYESIMEAGDLASEGFDIKILSAPLIKRMREAFPEVENGFSSDGYHIVDSSALYALSALWYDTLVSPLCATTRQNLQSLPGGVNADGMEKIEEIIRQILDIEAPEDPDSVGMIYE